MKIIIEGLTCRRFSEHSQLVVWLALPWGPTAWMMSLSARCRLARMSSDWTGLCRGECARTGLRVVGKHTLGARKRIRLTIKTTKNIGTYTTQALSIWHPMKHWAYVTHEEASQNGNYSRIESLSKPHTSTTVSNPSVLSATQTLKEAELLKIVESGLPANKYALVWHGEPPKPEYQLHHTKQQSMGMRGWERHVYIPST